MSDEANRILDEIENRGQFISAAHEVERLRKMQQELQQAIAMLAYQVGCFQVELEHQTGMRLEDLEWAHETEERLDPS